MLLQSSYTSEDEVTVLPLSFSNTVGMVLKLLFLGIAKINALKNVFSSIMNLSCKIKFWMASSKTA